MRTSVKIVIYCLSCIGSLSLVSAQTTLQVEAMKRPDTLNFTDSKGRKQGVWTREDTTGLSYRGQFKDDRPMGMFRYFDKHNTTVVVSEFFRDGYASKTTYYTSQGQIVATGYYLDKKKDSVWLLYGPDGKILKEESYKNGMLEGLVKTFDADSNIIETQVWYRDLRNGLWWEKTPKGIQTCNYVLNRSHGEYKAYYPDKTLRIKGLFDQGLKEQDWKFYYEEGDLEKILYYKKNELIKKEIAIKIDTQTILLSTDTVAYLHTNGKFTWLHCVGGKDYKTPQSFERLAKAFDTDMFFLATPKFMAAYNQYQSLELLTEDEEDSTSVAPLATTTDDLSIDDDEAPKTQQQAILYLKIPTPYEIIIDTDVIEMLQSMRSTKNVEEE
ncbi:hypothetical protein FACS1894201_04920 [Bacteroidia bacterium]|nr:hypothetical protein FACS1894201_04920 [Bacteroidia bacterium]